MHGPAGRIQFSSGTTYRPDIDGLRAIAVILVVIFHAFPDAMPAGFIGVDVFFVISGFLITGIVIRDIETQRFSLGDFYRGRVRRIFPALVIVLLFSLAVGWLVLLPAAYSRLSTDALASAAFVANIRFLLQSGYFDTAAATKPLLHLWSLGIEEQFYVVWPLMLGLVHRYRINLLATISVIGIASFALNIAMVDSHPVATFYLPFTRAWELASGAALAVAWNQLPQGTLQGGLRGWIGGAILVASLLLIDQQSTFPGWWVLLPVGGTLLLISAPDALGIRRVLGQKKLVGLGLISYPLYLWHWPLLAFARIEGFTSPIHAATAITLSSILAALTTYFVERPIRFGRLRPIGVRGAAVSMVFVAALSLAIDRSGGILWRYPADVRPVLETMSYDPKTGTRVDECWLDTKTSFDSYSPICGKGTTVVWGDSHAATLLPGLDGSVGQFTRDSCMPLVEDPSLPQICAASNARILAEIERTRPGRVILFAVWENYKPSATALAITLQRLHASVDSVVLLGPPPTFYPSLPELAYDYWKLHGKLPERLTPTKTDYRGIDRTLQSAAATAGVSFISVHDALCNVDGCLTHSPRSQSDLLSWDYGHLTAGGARFVADLTGLNRTPAQRQAK